MKASAAQKNLIRSIAGVEARKARMKASVYEAAERNGFITVTWDDGRKTTEITELGRKVAGL